MSPVEAAAAWNKRYPVGTAVTVRLDSGRATVARTRARAAVVSERPDAAVVWLVGLNGCHALDRVVPCEATT